MVETNTTIRAKIMKRVATPRHSDYDRFISSVMQRRDTTRQAEMLILVLVLFSRVRSPSQSRSSDQSSGLGLKARIVTSTSI